MLEVFARRRRQQDLNHDNSLTSLRQMLGPAPERIDDAALLLEQLTGQPFTADQLRRSDPETLERAGEYHELARAIGTLYGVQSAAAAPSVGYRHAEADSAEARPTGARTGSARQRPRLQQTAGPVPGSPPRRRPAAPPPRPASPPHRAPAGEDAELDALRLGLEFELTDPNTAPFLADTFAQDLGMYGRTGKQVSEMLGASDAAIAGEYPSHPEQAKIIVARLQELRGSPRGLDVNLTNFQDDAAPEAQEDSMALALHMQTQEILWANRGAVGGEAEIPANWQRLLARSEAGSDGADSPDGELPSPLAARVAEINSPQVPEAPAPLCDPLTRRPFVDPYTSGYGQTWEAARVRQNSWLTYVFNSGYYDDTMRSLGESWNSYATQPDRCWAEIFKGLCCPITRQLMSDPVLAVDGHVYERRAITRLVGQPSPLHRNIIVSDTLIPHPRIAQLTQLPEVQELKSRQEREMPGRVVE